MHVLVLVTVAHDPQLEVQLLIALHDDQLPVAVQHGVVVVVVVVVVVRHCVDGGGSVVTAGCGPHE